MLLTKDCAKTVRGEFIPGGKLVDISNLKFRKTKVYEVYRCCRRTGLDPQSGPFFCGDIAEFVAPVKEGGVVALCERHKPPSHLIIDEKSEKE